MGRLSKEALLTASDLEESDVNLPSIGGSVRIRALSGAYTREAASKATVVMQVGNQQKITVDRAKLEAYQLLHALVDPELNSLEEAERFARQTGPAYQALIDAIDKASEFDKEAISQAEERFQAVGASPNGSDVASGDPSEQGDRRPDLPARAGA